MEIKSYKFRLKINKNRINKIKNRNRNIKLAQYHKLNNQKLFKI